LLSNKDANISPVLLEHVDLGNHFQLLLWGPNSPSSRWLAGTAAA